MINPNPILPPILSLHHSVSNPSTRLIRPASPACVSKAHPDTIPSGHPIIDLARIRAHMLIHSPTISVSLSIPSPCLVDTLNHTVIHIRSIIIQQHIPTQFVTPSYPISQYHAHATSTSCSFPVFVSSCRCDSCSSCTPSQCQQPPHLVYQAYLTGARVQVIY